MRVKRSFQARLQSVNPDWNPSWGHKNPSCPTTSAVWRGGGGGTGVFFHIVRGSTFHTDRKYKRTVPEFEYHEQSNNDNNVKGRLRLHLNFWKSIGAYENIIDTIYNGYRIPFIGTPSPFFFKNNKSATQNSKFVEEAILDLLRSGRIKESYMPPLVVNPLTVSENSCGKKRFILDLSYINQFI